MTCSSRVCLQPAGASLERGAPAADDVVSSSPQGAFLHACAPG